ncbi:MAG: phosphate ABC transporter permease PstA [Gemmatimonadaceae bacterium]|nr:phosphate ABC transporter permease PstA [Gemmatimonadaceae bacterium]
MIASTWIAAALALLPLIAILAHLVMTGASALSPAFFVRTPAPAGVPDGGMANAIVGTCLLLGVAILIGVPIGLGAGLYCADARTTRLAQSVRFVADVLSGLPSIVTGVVVWELVVRPAGHFSAYAGGLALGLLMIPMITRATEDMVRLVPSALVEAAYALGFTRWRTAITVLLRTALPGIVTASLVAIARAAGETAPLLFTAFGSPYWSVDLGRPIAALPLQIYAFSQSPYDDWRAQAALGALVLVVMIAALSLTARTVLAARARFVRSTASNRPATIDIERAP